jgi:hypothetical protein
MEAQIEEAIRFRKKANFKILTRLSQIIDQYPYLRFHQILMIYIKFNIVKDVITDKLKDKAAREAAKDKAAEKARLTELLAKKQSEKMESMSEDEIRQRLAELG